MGGVGKTTICRVLAHQCAKQVNAVIWLEGQAGLEEALQTAIAPKLDIDIKHPDWLGLLMDKLNQCEPPSVMFLDNLEQSEANTAILNTLKRLNWHLVATSRHPLPEFTKKHEVDVLPLEHCVALFIQHYEMAISEADQVTLEALIELAGRHTLTVELLAKVAKDGLLDVPQLFEQVTQTGFDLSRLTDTVADGLHSGTELQSQRQHQLHEHLSKLFQLAGLAPNEQEILRIVAILPYQTYHGKNDLMVWLGLDKPLPLVKLAQKGWLQRTGQHFAAHPVVADVAKHQISLDPTTLGQFTRQFNQTIQPGETGHWIKQAGYASPLEALIEARPEGDTVTADLLASLAQIHHAKGEYGEALPLFERDLAIREKAHDQDHPEIAAARNNLGEAYRYLGQYDKAIECYQLALASDLKTYGEDHPTVSNIHNNLGLASSALGQYDKAIEFYQLALELGLKAYGEDHSQMALYRSNLGLTYDSLGQYDKAIAFYQLALASDLKTYGENHPTVAIDRNSLGAAYTALGQYQKAIDYHQQALESGLKTHGEDHPTVATYHNNLGSAYKSLGQYDKAIEFYQLALASDLKTYGEDHPEVAIDRNNLGVAYNSLGKYDKAIGFYQLALDSLEKTFNQQHPYVKGVKTNLEAAKPKLKKIK